jgi:glutamine synthetase
MSENTMKLIADSEARWVDLRFTDPRGKEQHVTFPASKVDSEFLPRALCSTGLLSRDGRGSMSPT